MESTEMKDASGVQRVPQIVTGRSTRSQSIDWYAEGESRTVDVGGVHFEVRYVARKGRRGRIAIEAPPGATFRSLPGE